MLAIVTAVIFLFAMSLSWLTCLSGPQYAAWPFSPISFAQSISVTFNICWLLSGDLLIYYILVLGSVCTINSECKLRVSSKRNVLIYLIMYTRIRPLRDNAIAPLRYYVCCQCICCCYCFEMFGSSPFYLHSLSDVHTVTLLPCLASIFVTTFLSETYESFELRTVGNLIY